MHGGPDAQGVPRWDFSTNANACGPAPAALRALQEADPGRYPDPGYQALRERLAEFHRVPADRIVLAASASEFIGRFTAAVAQRWPQASVHVPRPGYGDYERAMQAQRLRAASLPGDARLVWHTEPASPRGISRRPPVLRDESLLVIDAAYAPLQLEGEALAAPATAWQLMSPNKALGLTGVRAAYAIAPASSESMCESLARLAPSWPLGAHGVAMLTAWVSAPVQQWLRASLDTLRVWKQRQWAQHQAMGWICEPSVTPFYVARIADESLLPQQLQRLRAQGVKLRDATSLGLPGCVRVSVQAPDAQDALQAAWQRALAP